MKREKIIERNEEQEKEKYKKEKARRTKEKAQDLHLTFGSSLLCPRVAPPITLNAILHFKIIYHCHALHRPKKM